MCTSISRLLDLNHVTDNKPNETSVLKVLCNLYDVDSEMSDTGSCVAASASKAGQDLRFVNIETKRGKSCKSQTVSEPLLKHYGITTSQYQTFAEATFGKTSRFVPMWWPAGIMPMSWMRENACTVIY
jgi:hypothetical protein